MAERSTHLAAGSRIGPYEIISLLGQGGMATVYKAYQTSLDRAVAVKIMADRYAADPAFVERFRREARSIARLHHPNILTVHDAGEADGLLYMVMEYIEGDTLRDEMQGRPLSLTRCAQMLGQVAGALHYANSQGIVHRDVKPSNVLIDQRNDRAVLADFGIAKLLDGSSKKLTGTNEGMGTPQYMSPEQAQGEQLDARSDEYSLAAMAFEMLSGRPPFVGETPISVIMGHISKEVPSMQTFNGSISPAIESVIRRALSKQPDDRYPTVAAFNEALQKALFSGSAAEPTRELKMPTLSNELLAYNQPVNWPPTPTPPLTEAYLPGQPVGNNLPAPGLTHYNGPYPSAVYKVAPDKPARNHLPVGWLVGIGLLLLLALVIAGIVILNANGLASKSSVLAVTNSTPTTSITRTPPTSILPTKLISPISPSATATVSPVSPPATATVLPGSTPAGTVQAVPNNLKYKSYTGLSNIWQAELPADWNRAASGDILSLADTFAQGNGVISILVTFIPAVGNSNANDTNFKASVIGSTNNPSFYTDVQLESGSFGSYTSWAVNGKYTSSLGTFPFREVAINRKDGTLAVTQQMYSDLGNSFDGVLDHFMATLKISDTPATLPTATPNAEGNSAFTKYTSMGGKWRAEIPSGWDIFTNAFSNNLYETWSLGATIEIGVENKSLYGVGNNIVDQLKDQAHTDTQNVGLTDINIQEHPVGKLSAVLVLAKKRQPDGQDYSYADLLVGSGDQYYAVTVEVKKAEGAPYYQSVLDKLISTFQLAS